MPSAESSGHFAHYTLHSCAAVDTVDQPLLLQRHSSPDSLLFPFKPFFSHPSFPGVLTPSSLFFFKDSTFDHCLFIHSY